MVGLNFSKTEVCQSVETGNWQEVSSLLYGLSQPWLHLFMSTIIIYGDIVTSIGRVG